LFRHVNYLYWLMSQHYPTYLLPLSEANYFLVIQTSHVAWP